MSSRLLLSGLALAAISLTACNEINIDKFVEQSVFIQPTQVQTDMRGDLVFTQTTLSTVLQRVCDRQICGSSQERVCRIIRDCDYMDLSLITDAQADDALPSDDSDIDDKMNPVNPPPVSHPVPGGGGGGSHSGGGGGGGGHTNPPPVSHPTHPNPPPVSHPTHPNPPPVYHPAPRPPHCYDREVCRWETVPRYCDVNCRDVPREVSSITQVPSTITVRLVGIAPNEMSRVQELKLGVKTNAEFQQALKNPGNAPKKMRDALGSLAQTDRTILVMKAKGLKLVQVANFMSIPSDFKPGSSLVIEVKVEETGSKSSQVSAIGTSADFPSLDFTVHR